MLEFISALEAAKKWGISKRRVPDKSSNVVISVLILSVSDIMISEYFSLFSSSVSSYIPST